MGNGTHDGVTEFSESVLKFTPSLTLSAFFTNPNQPNDDAVDADFAANRFLIIPGTAFGVAAGKDFSVYLLNLADMSQAQTFKTNGGGTPGPTTGSYGMAYFNGTLFLPITTGAIYAFSWQGSLFSGIFVQQSNTYGFPGPAQMAGSINGTSNGILWAVTCASGTHTTLQQGILRGDKSTDASRILELLNVGEGFTGEYHKLPAAFPPSPTGGYSSLHRIQNCRCLGCFRRLACGGMRPCAGLL